MFPKDFLWGAATSSHQVEGDNIHNDWWQWEEEGKVPHRSGQATGHYDRFKEDLALAAGLGHNAHRFSIEWSRVEPREGEFELSAIDHYHQVLDVLAHHKITPLVTLHHFTNPRWFAQKGGWLHPKADEWFARYVEHVVCAFKDKVRYWITINEPAVMAYYGYLTGEWPPGKRSFFTAVNVLNRCACAHKKAHQRIHELHDRDQNVMVGPAHSVRPFAVCPQKANVLCRWNAKLRHYWFNQHFLDAVKSACDFIGLNYYEREYISHDPAQGFNAWGNNCNVVHQHSRHINQMGWGMFPEGLREALDFVKSYKKPMIVTENGTAETDDRYRQKFLVDHLKVLQEAVKDRLDVRGYLHWSLLDNFEWHKGFDPRFGLVDVDYRTFQRTPRSSALLYKKIIENNAIDERTYDNISDL